MRLRRLAIPITVVGVVLMLAGAGTVPAAARVQEPGVMAPSAAAMNLPAVATDAPETSAASGPAPESVVRVNPSPLPHPPRPAPQIGKQTRRIHQPLSPERRPVPQERLPAGERSMLWSRRKARPFRRAPPTLSGTSRLMMGARAAPPVNRRNPAPAVSRCSRRRR